MRKAKDKFVIYLIKYNIECQFEMFDKINLGSDDIQTIKSLKYYISDNYKKIKLCPCILHISIPLNKNNEFYFSDDNYKPEKKIVDCFPDHKIYITINLKEKCNCGYNKLDRLSKIEIYEKYRKEIYQLKNKLIKEINKRDQRIKELEDYIKGLTVNLDKNKYNKAKLIETNISIINNKNKKQKSNIIKFEENNFFDSNRNFEDFYDIIININSIKEINKGWEIKINKRGENQLDLFRHEKALIIGVIGNSNKGKTFLLSKISKINLPFGYSIKTEGLSVKYPELEEFKDRRIILLDSAGLETPLIFNNINDLNINNEILKENIKDKVMTELFLQNYIIHNSDILIIVVGILTYSEQKLLNRIKKEMKRLKINKTLYIIHNLMTYTTIKQVEDYINNCLLKSATFILEKKINITTELKRDSGVCYYETNTNNQKIFHLIFANEGSEAGEYYNNYTLNFIEESYKTITEIKSFDVIETIKERFIEVSKKIMKNNPNFSKTDFLDTKNMLKQKQFKLENNNNFNLKQCYIDELGFSNIKDNEFNPYYNYYIKNNYLIIRIEAPGNVDIEYNISYDAEYTIIELDGYKRLDKEPKNLTDNIFNSRQFGNFQINIFLHSEHNIKNRKPIIFSKSGILIIKFELEVINKKIATFNQNPEDEV